METLVTSTSPKTIVLGKTIGIGIQDFAKIADKNMFYIEEEKRGFYPEENHIVSGVFEINIEDYLPL